VTFQTLLPCGMRWAKRADNWLALIRFAYAHILFNLVIYGLALK
jgi:hypothetical protein